MDQTEIKEIYDQLTLLGFKLDPDERRIIGKEVLLSLLSQVGLHPQGFENAEGDPRAPYDILQAMKIYAGNLFDIQKINIGHRPSIEINQHTYQLEWGGLGSEFVSKINHALLQEKIPFRWVWVEAYDPDAGPSYASALLFLPLNLIQQLSQAFEYEAEFLFEAHDLEALKSALPPETQAFDFNKTATVSYHEVIPYKIPKNLIFQFDAEGFYGPEDYRPVLEGAFALTNGKLSLENLEIIAMDDAHCKATIRVAGKKPSKTLSTEGWVDSNPLMDLLNAAAKELGTETRFFELNTKDQSMKITFMTQDDFMRHHGCYPEDESQEASAPKSESKSFFEKLTAWLPFLRPKKKA